MKTCRLLQCLHSQILSWSPINSCTVGVSTVILEVTLVICGCHWLQNLFLTSRCIKIVSHDDKPCFSSELDSPPHNITLLPPKAVTSSVQQSELHSIFLTFEHNVPPFSVHVCTFPTMKETHSKASS